MLRRVKSFSRAKTKYKVCESPPEVVIVNPPSDDDDFGDMPKLRKKLSFRQNLTNAISENPLFQAQWKRNSSPPRQRRMSRSLNDLGTAEELLKDFSEKEETSESKPINPPFPVLSEKEEDECTQLRARPTNFNSLKRPKTYDPSHSINNNRPPLDEYKVKGLIELVLNKTQSKVLSTGEYLYITDEYLEVRDEKGTGHLRYYCKLENDQLAQINKKKLAILDQNTSTHYFIFKSSKDAKIFTEWYKSRKLGVANQSSIIKKTITKFLRKRASREMLVDKGILKNEAIFGNAIETLYSIKKDIPEFLKKIIGLIELPENITQMGIYRASGNMATIQKIRLNVDEGKLAILEDYKSDVDLLTGTLKLFFRELRDSLLTFSVFNNILDKIDKFSTSLLDPTGGDRAKLGEVKDQIETLPTSHYKVLSFLLDHLVKVCSYHEQNKMDYHNMAIAWGPSLISFDNIEGNLNSIAFHSTNSHKVTEFLLMNYKHLFEPIREEDRQYKVVCTLINLIERDIRTDGIYRRSGAVGTIDEIERLLNECKLNDLAKFNVDDLCASLKKYISKRLIPLFSPNVLSQFDEINRKSPELESHEKRKILMNALRTEKNFRLIELLLNHLQNVIDMNNLSINSLISTWSMVLLPDSDKEFKERISKISDFLNVLLVVNNRKNLPDVVSNNRILSTYENVDDKTDCTKL